jgi:NitT/TauT family transport system substrate-binding protein
MKKINVNEVTHSIFYAPFYAAINNGYFAQENIEIELVNGGGSDKSMTALLSGQAQFALLGPETAVYVLNEGREDYAVILAQLTKKDGSFLLGKTPDESFTWDKLRGKTIIGGRKGSMPQMMLEYAMKKNGIIPNVDATVRTDVSFDLMGGAFIGGSDDYVALFEPVASTMALADEGYIVASIGQESGDVPYTCFTCLQSYLQNNTETAKAFLRALKKGQDFVKSSSVEDIASSISPSFPDSDTELLKAVIKRYKDIDVWNDGAAMKEDDYLRLIEIIKDAGIIETAPDFDIITASEFW